MTLSGQTNMQPQKAMVFLSINSTGASFKACLLAMALLASATFLCAQIPQVTLSPSAPKTEIEQFAAKTGSVIVRGFSNVGNVGGVSVEADEFANIGDKSKAYGIKIGIKHADEDEVYSYIDSDEIDSLLAGLDSIGKIQKTVTKLDDFEGTYKTRGGVSISTFTNNEGTISAAVDGGNYPAVRVILSLDDLAKLADLIKSAQATLNGLK